MHIAVIDQDREITTWLEKCIPKWGHHLLSGVGLVNATEYLDKEPYPDMIICDRQTIQSDDGGITKKIENIRRNKYVYVLLMDFPSPSGDGETPGSIHIDDRIIKPLESDELQSRIALGRRIVILENELNQKYIMIKRTYFQTVDALIQLMFQYDPVLGGHCRRVGQLVLELAKRHQDANVTDYPVMQAAGSLHDIGFLALPKSLIGKGRAAMNGDEVRHYRTHPERGEAILNQVDLLKPVARIVRNHHEQFNGRGFPDGLETEKIPLCAQLVHAASNYDHLMHVENIAVDLAVENIQQWRGYQLSPRMVDILLDLHLKFLQSEAEKNDRCLHLNDLKEGMILSRDVIMKSGAFCMANGNRLDKGAIDKLKQYHQRGNISDELFIFK